MNKWMNFIKYCSDISEFGSYQNIGDLKNKYWRIREYILGEE